MGNSIRRMEIVGFENPGIDSNYLLNVEILEFINPDGTPYRFTPAYQPIYLVRRGEWDPTNTYLAGDALLGETSIFGGGTAGEVAYQYLWQFRSLNDGANTWTNIGTWANYDNTTIMVTCPEVTKPGHQYKLLSRARDASVDPVDTEQRATGGVAKLISAQPFSKDTSWINVSPDSGGQTVEVGDTIIYTTPTYEPDGGTPGYCIYEYFWRLQPADGTGDYEIIDPPGFVEYNNDQIQISLVVPPVESDGTRLIGPRARAQDTAPNGPADSMNIGTVSIYQQIAAYTPVFEQTPGTWVTPLNGSTVGETITGTPAIFGGGNANTTFQYAWQYLDENGTFSFLPANVVDAQYIGWQVYDNLGGQQSLPLTLTSTTNPLFNGGDWFANKKIVLRSKAFGNGESLTRGGGDQNLINPAAFEIEDNSVWDPSNVYEVGETISAETTIFSGGTPYPLPGENGNVWELRWQVRPDTDASWTLLSGPDYWTGPESTTKSLLIPPEADEQQLRPLMQVIDRSNNPPAQDVRQEAPAIQDITGPPIVVVSAPDYSVNGEIDTGNMTTAQTAEIIPGVFSGGYGTLTPRYRWRYKVGGEGSWINQPWQFTLPLAVDGDNPLLNVGDTMQFQQRMDDEIGTAKTATSTPLININAATTIGTLSIAPPSTTADAGDTVTFDALISGDADPDYTWSIRNSGPATFVGGNTGSQVQVQINAGTASGTSINVQCDAVDNEASDSPKSTASIIIVN